MNEEINRFHLFILFVLSFRFTENVNFHSTEKRGQDRAQNTLCALEEKAEGVSQ